MEEDSDSKNDDQWGSWRGLYFGMFREKQNSKELMQKMKLYYPYVYQLFSRKF